MYRPGWFPEYSPKQQQIFDAIYGTIAQTFAQYGYQHIWTPAVENTNILKKWWEESSKQIFGLYGMAQGPEDAKDYSLHFDLTVPFARYALDRQNELAFPFKRYQIQPVWRGERNQKGRYKEFRQADIDVIWKSKEDKWYNDIYDADCIIALAKAIEFVGSQIGLEIKSQFHVNNKLFTYALIELIAGKDRDALLKLFDGYHKIAKEKFAEELTKLGIKDSHIDILNVLCGKDIAQLRSFTASSPAAQDALDKLEAVTQKLDAAGVSYIIDPFIVRGLDYYTGTVFETFVDGKIELGSICSGWAYANLTDFIDKKQSFSGVGWSIGLSRLLSILLEDYDLEKTFVSPTQTYLIVNDGKFADTAQKVIAQYHADNKVIELFPLAEDFLKQIKYAQQKGITHIIKIKSDTEYEVVKTDERQGKIYSL